MSDGRGPSKPLQQAAVAAYALEVATRNDATKRKGGQSRLARDMKARAERDQGANAWAPTQQAIAGFLSHGRVGWGGVKAIEDFLGLTDADLLKKYGAETTGVVPKGTKRGHDRGRA